MNNTYIKLSPIAEVEVEEDDMFEFEFDMCHGYNVDSNITMKEYKINICMDSYIRKKNGKGSQMIPIPK